LLFYLNVTNSINEEVGDYIKKVKTGCSQAFESCKSLL